MKTISGRLSGLDEPGLSVDERVLLRCSVAAELIHVGNFEDAQEALGGLWRGVGNGPDLEGLSGAAAAEVLLQSGVLSGWLGSVRQMPEAQERAKDLLSAALRGFESEGRTVKVAEVQHELGMCYFRLGAYDEARVVLQEALERVEDEAAELKAKILIRQTLVEIWTGKYHQAWDILKAATPFFEKCNDAIKGRWHGQMALVFDKLANAERDAEHLDRAVIEYTAAIYHYEEARHERYAAVNLNNLAMLLYEFGRYEDAHRHLDRAAEALKRLEDEGLLAQVNETRARVLLAEGKYPEADQVIEGVISVLERGGQSALLASALTVRGVVLSRLGRRRRSMEVLRRAMELAEEAGAASEAGHAALSLMEEHGDDGERGMTEAELAEIYARAEGLLKETQDAEEIRRLRDCARVVVRRLAAVDAEPGDEDFVLSEAVRSYESRLIERALKEENGVVTRAAERLGVKYQTLIEMLKTRHRNLLRLRTPPRRRQRRKTPDT